MIFKVPSTPDHSVVPVIPPYMVLPLLLLGPERAACGTWIFLKLLFSRSGHCFLLAELAPGVVGGQAGTDWSGMSVRTK